MSTSHKRNPITTNRRQLISTYNDSSVDLLYDNNKCSTIHDLDLAHGLIELLIENNFTLKSLMNIGSSELSKTLGIDQEVATLICKAAKNKKINIKV
jgi:hypothetical protein